MLRILLVEAADVEAADCIQHISRNSCQVVFRFAVAREGRAITRYGNGHLQERQAGSRPILAATGRKLQLVRIGEASFTPAEQQQGWLNTSLKACHATFLAVVAKLGHIWTPRCRDGRFQPEAWKSWCASEKLRVACL